MTHTFVNNLPYRNLRYTKSLFNTFNNIPFNQHILPIAYFAIYLEGFLLQKSVFNAARTRNDSNRSLSITFLPSTIIQYHLNLHKQPDSLEIIDNPRQGTYCVLYWWYVICNVHELVIKRQAIHY